MKWTNELARIHSHWYIRWYTLNDNMVQLKYYCNTNTHQQPKQQQQQHHIPNAWHLIRWKESGANQTNNNKNFDKVRLNKKTLISFSVSLCLHCMFAAAVGVCVLVWIQIESLEKNYGIVSGKRVYVLFSICFDLFDFFSFHSLLSVRACDFSSHSVQHSDCIAVWFRFLFLISFG